jgi:polyhydroxyalkanoate synthesis regulator protein
VPRYLEHTMEYFAKNQEQMRDYMRDTFGGMFPFGRFEEMGKQNLAFFERAMKMFAPFQGGAAEKPEETEGKVPNGPDTLAEIKAQIDALQKRLDSMSAKNDKGK